jgi:hypothetical protein
MLVQAAPPCRHGTHCPPSQSSPWQQSADELQAPVAAQHLFASHCLLQQSSGPEQASPVAWQTAGWHECWRHVRALQQSVSVAHGPALIEQPHLPPTQGWPSQQSVATEQLWPPCAHVHAPSAQVLLQWPLKHNVAEQQSESLAHDAPSAAQPLWQVLLCCVRPASPKGHPRPLQQPDEAAHISPACLQGGGPGGGPGNPNRPTGGGSLLAQRAESIAASAKRRGADT